MDYAEKAAYGMEQFTEALIEAGFTGKQIVRHLVYIAGALTYAWNNGKFTEDEIDEISEIVGETFGRGVRNGPASQHLFPAVDTPWDRERGVSDYSITKTGV